MSYTSRVYEKVLRHDSAWLPQGTDDAGLLARDKYSGSSKLQPSRFCLMLAQVADPQRVNHPHICAIPADRPKLRQPCKRRGSHLVPIQQGRVQ